MTRTLEQLTALLRKAGIDPDGHGERSCPIATCKHHRRYSSPDQRVVDDSPENIARIVAHDVAVNWPRIEAERRAK